MVRKRIDKTQEEDMPAMAAKGAPEDHGLDGIENSDTGSGAPGESATIEDMLDEVDSIIAQLDSGEIPLEDSFKIYERGMKLVSSINTRIDKVEKKVIEIESKCSQTMPSEDDEPLPFN